MYKRQALAETTVGVKANAAAISSNGIDANAQRYVMRGAGDALLLGFVGSTGQGGSAYTVTENFDTQRSNMGVWGLTRIEDVLCFANRELIFPVRNASAVTGFWPYVGVGQ